MRKKRVLFICVHNSARSQMAEAFLNQRCGETFEARSAGVSPGVLNPAVVKVMREVGIDISQNQTKSVQAVLSPGLRFDYVITVCSEADAAGCPVFPGDAQRLHWPFSDPSSFRGSDEERIDQTRAVRDLIQSRINEWCTSVCPLT